MKRDDNCPLLRLETFAGTLAVGVMYEIAEERIVETIPSRTKIGSTFR